MALSAGQFRGELGAMMAADYKVGIKNLPEHEVEGLVQLANLAAHVAKVAPQTWGSVTDQLCQAWETILDPHNVQDAYDELLEKTDQLSVTVPMNPNDFKTKFYENDWFADVEGSGTILTHLRMWLGDQMPKRKLYQREYYAWQAMSALLAMAGKGENPR